MPETLKREGSCLCGAVRVMADAASEHIGACHCDMCRKWGGGPLIAADCGKDVSFEGEENITVYNSSEWAERGFCKRCGTHLFYRMKKDQQCIVPAGLFDDESSFVLTHQIFIDQKPSCYRFANETENMTASEVFAQYAPPPD